MYLKMAGETLNGSYESLTDDQLRQMLDALKKQNPMWLWFARNKTKHFIL